MKKRLVVGLSGASGAILCVSLLEAMRREKDWEVHLVSSKAGERVLREETGMSGADLAGLAFRTHDIGNIGAAIASGTFETEGMAVVPCSMKTLAGICHGYAENLLLRAADVTLKERRKLVLVARETPFGLVHLRNMTALAEMGVSRQTLSFEARLAQIRDMSGPLETDLIVYGRLPLMIFENCAIRRQHGGKCSCKNGVTVLTDRRHESFPLLPEYGCRNTLIGNRPLCLREDFARLGVQTARLLFTTESPEECAHIARAFLSGAPLEGEFTRGLYKRGVE